MSPASGVWSQPLDHQESPHSSFLKSPSELTAYMHLSGTLGFSLSGIVKHLSMTHAGPILSFLVASYSYDCTIMFIASLPVSGY